MIIVENVKDFCLDHIFDCGQCFRWTKEENGSYSGVAFSRSVNINFESIEKGGLSGRLLIDNTTREEFDNIWRPYLDLDSDYSDIKKRLSEKDETIRRAIKHGGGIRILRQDTWEALVSFIISQNNNIPRIKGCIETLCQAFGEPLGEYDGRSRFDIPKPEVLASLSEGDLDECRLGYRAKYLIETAKKICEDGGETLASLRDVDCSKAFEYLTSLCGVGPKVANCVLLFGAGKKECFPIDVWVRRVMNKLYLIDEEDVKAMAQLAEARFGDYGGIAQQYLFYYMRSGHIQG